MIRASSGVSNRKVCGCNNRDTGDQSFVNNLAYKSIFTCAVRVKVHPMDGQLSVLLISVVILSHFSEFNSINAFLKLHAYCTVVQLLIEFLQWFDAINYNLCILSSFHEWQCL